MEPRCGLVLLGVLLGCGAVAPPAAPGPGSANAPVEPGAAHDAGAEGVVRAADGQGSRGDGGVDATLGSPPDPGSNNLFGLVRTADDIAAEQQGRAVSRDGKATASVRTPEGGRPRIVVDGGDGRGERTLVDLAHDTTAEPMGSGAPLRASSGVLSLAFSPDARQLFFQADAWATSLALYAVSVDTGAVRFVSDANGYQVIDTCKDRSLIGKLVLFEHSYFDPLPQSAVDWFFLRDDHGKRLGIIGPEEHNVARFLARRCGVGKAPPPPARHAPAGKLARGPVRCGGQQLAAAPIALLDGTTLDFVRLVDVQALAEDPDTPAMLIDGASAQSLLEGCR